MKDARLLATIRGGRVDEERFWMGVRVSGGGRRIASHYGNENRKERVFSGVLFISGS